MASITTLLATDSLASSRIVLNDNFSALNDELTDVVSLLDPVAQTLSLTGNISAAGLTLATGGSNLFTVSASEVVSSVQLTAEDVVVLEHGLRHSVSNAVTQMPAANAYASTTYILDASALAGTNTVNVGDSGQEVTFIANGGTVSLDPANIAGANSVAISDNGTLTLRFYNNLWYIISEWNCTIS
jgi:hypothetical protein